MKIYLSGAITGVPDYRETFDRVAKKAEAEGNVVLNPAMLPGGLTQGDYMRICFAMIDCADEVWFLPDWARSKGALLEFLYCDKIEKPHRYLTESEV